MCVALILAADRGSPGMHARWVRVCSLHALAERQIIGVTVDGHQLIIIREGDRLFATERACPHEGADLSQGRCTGVRLHCPRHLAWFDLVSGAVSPGWSFRALETYPVRVERNEVLVDLARP